jgi:hypothetical protein
MIFSARRSNGSVYIKYTPGGVFNRLHAGATAEGMMILTDFIFGSISVG